ncbi:hypothetical protein ABT174_00315 [Streptomyces sparsogenes]|uniref:hypothetical protein n=1 Tax=Streptomyces sparsogenes TaxID=67365 RepID=UPI0033238F74
MATPNQTRSTKVAMLEADLRRLGFAGLLSNRLSMSLRVWERTLRATARFYLWCLGIFSVWLLAFLVLFPRNPGMDDLAVFWEGEKTLAEKFGELDDWLTSQVASWSPFKDVLPDLSLDQGPFNEPDEPGLLESVTATAALLSTLTVLIAIIAPLYLIVLVFRESVPPVSKFMILHRRYNLAAKAADVVAACAAAHGAAGERRRRKLNTVADSVTAFSRTVAKGYRLRGGVSRLSHRRQPLKHHARLTIAALRAAESRLDTETDQALQDLATLAVKVADQYVAGRLGALLDENELTGLEPVSEHELLRMGLAVVLIAAAAVGVAVLNLPAAAQTPLLGVSGVIILAVVFKRNYRAGLDILDSVRAIQRP